MISALIYRYLENLISCLPACVAGLVSVDDKIDPREPPVLVNIRQRRVRIAAASRTINMLTNLTSLLLPSSVAIFPSFLTS